MENRDWMKDNGDSSESLQDIELEQEELEQEEKEKKEKLTLWDWAKSILLALALALFIRTFLLSTTSVRGDSMKETLHNGDFLFVNKTVHYFGNLNYGDIVILDAPPEIIVREDGTRVQSDEQKYYIKRIVGMPGDTISIEEGKVVRNGKALDETYTNYDVTTPYDGHPSEWTLGEDEFFVMGDNRQPFGSKDSRIFGPIAKDKIEGKAFFRLMPFQDMGGL